MSETDQDDKTTRGARAASGLTRGAPAPAAKRTVESGHVRQSFSHGRSKAVVVEVKKRRPPGSPAPAGTTSAGAAPATALSERRAEAPPRPVAAPAPKSPAAAAGTAAPAPAPAAAAAAKPRTAGAAPGRNLSNDEREARIRALSVAREREAEERRAKAEEEARRRVAEEQAKKEREELLRKQQDEERQSRLAAAAAAAKAAETEGPTVDASAAAEPAAAREAARPAPADARPAAGARPAPARPSTARPGDRGSPDRAPAGDRGPARPVAVPAANIVELSEAAQARRAQLARREQQQQEDDDERGRRAGGAAGFKPGAKTAVPEKAPVKKVVDDKRMARGRLTITNALDNDQRERSLSALKRRREREKAKANGMLTAREKIQREVVIPEAITIQELSNRMAERGVDIIKYLMKSGEMHKITDVVDADTAELIVAEFGHISKRVSDADVEEGFIDAEDSVPDQQDRAPIVTIMGHVDHGKTSLLDTIRSANVVSGEAGGITQHIGAYQVVSPTGQKVTFIDTPGHEAFTAMRARGAKVTDIVILVVAADDGVMPQTVEAINHAKSAKVPIIVAINKIDKPAADPKRVRNELLRHEIVVESMGGDTLEVEVSATKNINIDKLLETIGLQAEVLELKSNANRSAEGVVIEAKLEAGRGPVGTVLIQRGTLEIGNIIVAGSAWGRVRALIDDRGNQTRDAGPSVPVEVLGFSSAPEAGDQLAVVENEARARELVDYRIRKRRDRTAVGVGQGRSLEQMMSQLTGAGRKEFTLLIKGDVQGSVEAITASLEKLNTDEVQARVVHAGVGGITESDVSLAATSGAIIIAFNVRANVQARAHAERDGIEIRYYSIIYDLVDEVKSAMSGLLAPTRKEHFLGYALIQKVFEISKVGKVAGCRITEGRVERGAGVRLLRDNTVIHTGRLSTLKRFKDEVKDVPVGQECGMAFEKYDDIREGDQIECFTVEMIARTL